MTQPLRLSLGMFTILPVAPRGDFQPTPRQVRGMMLLAPLVGLLVGLALAAALFLIRQGISWLHNDTAPASATGLAALLTVGLLVLITGGLHLDGLADTVDAMACRKDRAGALAVMRRSDSGPLGVVALVIVLLIQVVALTVAIDSGHGTVAIVTAVLAGRLAAVWACRYPAARPDGQGSWVARSTNVIEAAALTGVALLVPLGLLFVDDDPAGKALPLVLGAIPVGLVVAGLLQRWWVRRFGGITGDTIGAGIEICTAVTLIVIALAP